MKSFKNLNQCHIPLKFYLKRAFDLKTIAILSNDNHQMSLFNKLVISSFNVKMCMHESWDVKKLVFHAIFKLNIYIYSFNVQYTQMHAWDVKGWLLISCH